MIAVHSTAREAPVPITALASLPSLAQVAWLVLLCCGMAFLASRAHAQAAPAINAASIRAVTILPDPGPVVPPTPLADPTVPSNLATAPAGTNFRLWIYDPRNRSAALGSPGIFIRSTSGSYVFRSANSDGSLYQTLTPDTYNFDVVEPNALTGAMVRKSYTATISATGAFTVQGVSVDARGYAAVTVTIVNVAAQAKLAALTAAANESALTYNPRSPCQLIDQVTTARSLSTDLSAGFPRVRIRLPNYGSLRALIVPIDFPDVPGTDNAAAFFTPLAESMRDFHYAQSYGRLAFDFSILPKWLRMPFLATKYNLGGAVGAGDPGGYRKEIISATDGLIDYSQYDAVYFLVPKSMPYSVMGWGPAITSPLATSTGYIVNGATGGADMYLPQNGPNAQRNWMAHETGHAFGLYDEDLDHASATLGNWGLMANNWSTGAIEHIGWDRYLLGWLDGPQVTCLPKHTLTTSGTTVTLNPLVRQNAENKVAMVPLSNSKILVLESRKNEGYDVIASGREGVLVYTVDMTIGQLKGGYRTQRRPGSTDANFVDAALRAGDTITVEGVTISVSNIASTGDTVVIKAATAPTTRTLSVTRAGFSYGTVTSDVPGINCTPNCVASYANGTTVTLTSTSTSFVGWSGDCTGTGSCTLTMNSDKNVTATFYGTTTANGGSGASGGGGSASPGTVGTVSGLWWIPAESGWGMSLTQRGSTMFMAWYTYDSTGAPIWYVMSNCPMVGNGCAGDIYAVSGGVPLTAVWANVQLAVARVGSGGFTFYDANTGSFSFSINGVSGQKNIVRQIFATGTTAPSIDYTALYWAAPANSESGWGVAITQQFNIIFVAIFTYDAAKKPIWYVASNCTLTGTTCTGALYQVNGGRQPTSVWGNPSLAVSQVGNITLSFTSAESGSMSFTINGVTGTKSITKQIF